MAMHELTKKDLKVIWAALARETSCGEKENDFLYTHGWDCYRLYGYDYIRVFKKISAICGKEAKK